MDHFDKLRGSQVSRNGLVQSQANLSLLSVSQKLEEPSEVCQRKEKMLTT